MTDSIRAFIAIEIDRETQNSLGNLINQINKTFMGSVKWTPYQNIHLTLKFLGEVETWELTSINQLIRNVANQSQSFTAVITKLGAFPTPNNPRIIWIGVEAPQTLFHLARTIEDSARNLGFDSEGRPFTPHLTMGRARPGITRVQQDQLAGVIRSISLPKFNPIQINSITLFQSILKPGGAEYVSLLNCRFNH
jgi:RNA 2',3'-cyclic 3'-phosphodiesterase